MEIIITVPDTAEMDAIAAFGADDKGTAIKAMQAYLTPILLAEIEERIVASANEAEQAKLQAVLHTEREAVKERLGTKAEASEVVADGVEGTRG